MHLSMSINVNPFDSCITWLLERCISQCRSMWIHLIHVSCDFYIDASLNGDQCESIWFMYHMTSWVMHLSMLINVNPFVCHFFSAGLPIFKFHVMRLNRYVGSFMFLVLAAEIFTVIFIIYFWVREIKKMKKQKKDYLKVILHNIVSLLFIGMKIYFTYYQEKYKNII